MGGLGLAEALLILIFVGALGFAGMAGLSGVGNRKRALWKGPASSFENRVLDELEVLSVRLDALAQRLDGAGIPGPSAEPRLPGGEGEGPSTGRTGSENRELSGHEGIPE